MVSTLQINLNLKKSSSNKKVMSKNISKFARPVFLRPVFRPTPILFLWVNTIYRMEPEVKVTEAVRNLLEDVVDRNGKQQTEEIKEIKKYVKNEKQELSIPFSLVLYAYKNRSPGKTVYYDISSHDSIFIPIIIRILHLLYK